MSTEKFTQLPTVPSSTTADIICAVQGGVSVQETLSQVSALFLSNTILNFAGNPNGHLAGSTFQLCWDTVDDVLYICTTTGTSVTAVWTTTGDNGLIPPSKGGTGVSNPTAHTIPIAEGSSNFNFLSLTSGELLIGSTGNDPVPGTLTAGDNITITNAAGSITIAAAGIAGFNWVNVTGTSQAMSSNMGYIANNAGLVTLTLPLTASIGTTLSIQGAGAGGWTVAQNTGQNIQVGSTSTTVTTGSISSTNRYDSINLVCIVANTTWASVGGPQGNITIV